MNTPLKIAIQGQKGSYHDIVVQSYFDQEVELICCDSFKESFAALQSGEADYTVTAIENSLYGSINEVYDLLLKHKFWISGELYLRIRHQLLGIKGAKAADITGVHSHPVALAQCELFLENMPNMKRFEENDTAESARLVKQWNDPAKAAIAGSMAGELHDLAVLSPDIETNKQNYTRFLVLQNQKIDSQEANKSSLTVQFSNDTEAGALHDVLGVFATRDINLTKIESRPIIGKAWHYLFYLDVEVGSLDSRFATIMQELRDLKVETNLLGSYKNGEIIT